jgi:hypothetical protein
LRACVRCLGLFSLLAIACDRPPLIELPQPPTLEGSSADPVLLRYKFTVGDRSVWTSTVDVEMRIDAEDDSAAGTIDMELGGTYVVQAVDSTGAGTIELVMDRMAMFVDMGGATMSYDSDDPSSGSPELVVLNELVNRAFSLIISPLGEVDSADMPVAIDAFAGRQLVNNAFVALSEGPIAVGERFRSGSFNMPSAQGNVEVPAVYEVTSISGDGSELLLSPNLDLTTAFTAVPGMSVRSSSVEGWLLFDVEGGYISNSAIGLSIDFAVEADGESAGGEMVVNMLYDMTDFAAGAGAPEPTPRLDLEAVPIPEIQREIAADGTGSPAPSGLEAGTGQGAVTP